jgi:hypothetical protein
MSFCPLSISLGSDSSALVLADTTCVVEGPLKIDGVPLMQAVELARAADAVWLNRGNRRRTLAFLVKHPAASSPIDALAAVFAHELALEATTETSLVLSYGTGGDSFTLTMSNCLVKHTGWHQGKTQLASYVVQGGALALVGTTEPGDAILDSSGNPVLDSSGSALLAA